MSDLRPSILTHALPLVPFDGWSDYMLRQAAKRAGASDQELKRAFPRSVADCIDYFFASEDEALATAFPQSALAAKRVPERIETLVMARLEHMASHREAVRRALAYRALPWNAPGACSSLYRTVDLLWRLAGDNATDFNHYTKRMTLAALYSSTVVYWLNDQSGNMQNTREFLKRGLAGIAAFGRKKKEFTSKFSVV